MSTSAAVACAFYDTILQTQLAGNVIYLQKTYDEQFVVGRQVKLRVGPVTGNPIKITTPSNCAVASLVFAIIGGAFAIMLMLTVDKKSQPVNDSAA